ncbi:MAG: maleylacetoacetate isomerase [Paracoccaceae bacterium]
MITLFDYWRSSASYRVRLALNLLRLPYAAIPVDLVKGEQRAEANLARNPQGLVPTLQIDGMLLTQSLAIIEYLNDTHGGLLPDDAPGRARVRALSYAVAMEIAPICNLSVRNHVAQLAGGSFTADDWQIQYIGAGMSAVERTLDAPQTGLFCHGDEVSMADLCLIPQIYNARRVGLDVGPWPTIARIIARLETLPAVQAAHPEKVQP